MSRNISLFVVDAHNLLYKAHFAFQRRPLINSRKRDVSVCFGVTRMLIGLLKEFEPEYLAMAFDRRAPTFRHELYQEYKLNRPPMPAPIADNLQDVKDIVHALGIKIIEQDGFEADDILGTIVERFKDKDILINLVTNDKDLLQLVGPNVRVLMARKGLSDFKVFHREEVIEKYGVPPEKMVDYMAMVGDSIDNIPGIHGIGPKTAAKLITQFESLDEILRNPERITSKSIRKKIEENRQFALLSRKLIQIHTDADIPLDISEYRIRERNEDLLREIFQNLEFTSLMNELNLFSGRNERREYSIVNRRAELMDLSRRLRGTKCFSFDLETTSEDPMKAEIVGISVSERPLHAFYIPVMHRIGAANASRKDIRDAMLPILMDPSIGKIGQNIKYDWIVAHRAGLDLKGVLFDTMIASHLLNPGRHKHNLDVLCREYLNIDKIQTRELIGGKTGIATMDLVPVETVAEYACEDADTTYRLWEKMKGLLKAQGLDRVFYEIEMPLVEVLVDMEETGVRIDAEILGDLSRNLEKQLGKLTEEITIMAGESFNINSPKQLSKILFEKLQYSTKGIKKTKSGYSTAESELRKLAVQGGMFAELPEKLLEYRSLSKLKNTYLDALPKMINPATGRLHSNFNQTATETGRLSSSRPNLQNIPIRTPLGKEVRRAFVAAPGQLLVSADYSQMELRILAHIAEDEELIKAFENGVDIHAQTAAAIFNVPLDQVTPEQRRRAKTVNFGIDYGMTPFGLSERLGISMNQASHYIEKYLNHFKGVKKYIEDTKRRVIETGVVETLSGRRRYIPEASSDRRQVRESAFRQAINMPIQGTAADIIKVAMIRIYKELLRNDFRSKMVLQIHDELLFDVVPEEAEALMEMVTFQMENAWKLRIPLKVDIQCGNNWAEIH